MLKTNDIYNSAVLDQLLYAGQAETPQHVIKN